MSSRGQAPSAQVFSLPLSMVTTMVMPQGPPTGIAAMIEGVMGKIPVLPKFEHHDDRHEPALIAAARSQMTASSPRGTFSQAELAGDRVITRCITRPMTAPGATIRVMPGDLERLPVPVSQPDPRRRLRASCQPARGGVTGFLRWLGWPSMPGARWE
jgi:hypothetical protein